MNDKEPCSQLGVYIKARFNNWMDWERFSGTRQGREWDSHANTCPECKVARESWLESEQSPIIEIKLRNKH